MAQKKIRVIFMGTPEVGAQSLKILAIHRDFEVVAVVTQEDKPVGRKQILTPSPVKELAQQLGLTVLQPTQLKKNKEFLKLLKNLNADVGVVVAYGKILPPEILKIPKFGCVNIHFSLLPKYRGASPVEEALLQGDTSTGVAFMQMAPKLDSGDILLMQRMKIEPDDTAFSLREKLGAFAALQLPFVLKDLMEGLLRPLPQLHEKATYCHKISKEDGFLDFTQLSTDEVINRFRAYNPWPTVFFIENGKRVKITALKKVEENFPLKSGGKKVINQKLAMGTKDGAVLIEKLQVEGKNEMTVADFLKGNRHFFTDLVEEKSK